LLLYLGSATLPPEELPDRYTSKIRDKSIGKTDRSSFSSTEFIAGYIEKKKIKFSSYIRIFRVEQLQCVAKSYMRKGFLIYEEMRKYFPI
jgi:hypothetical protein